VGHAWWHVNVRLMCRTDCNTSISTRTDCKSSYNIRQSKVDDALARPWRNDGAAVPRPCQDHFALRRTEPSPQPPGSERGSLYVGSDSEHGRSPGALPDAVEALRPQKGNLLRDASVGVRPALHGRERLACPCVELE